MKEVLVMTKPKDSFTLVVSDNSANIQITSNPPLYLQANHSYEFAMVNLGTYNSFASMIVLVQSTITSSPVEWATIIVVYASSRMKRQ